MISSLKICLTDQKSQKTTFKLSTAQELQEILLKIPSTHELAPKFAKNSDLDCDLILLVSYRHFLAPLHGGQRLFGEELQHFGEYTCSYGS